MLKKSLFLISSILFTSNLMAYSLEDENKSETISYEKKEIVHYDNREQKEEIVSYDKKENKDK